MNADKLEKVQRRQVRECVITMDRLTALYLVKKMKKVIKAWFYAV